MLKAVFLSAVIVNLGMLLGRISGFARESFVAAAYGVSADADVIILMLTVPDLLVNILIGGALGAVLVPVFSKLPHQAARQLLYQCCIIFGVLTICISYGLVYYADFLVSILAPGFNGAQNQKAVDVLHWVLWLIPLTVMAGLSTAYLHAKNTFIVASLGTLIINTSIIIGLYYVESYDKPMIYIALFVISGGCLRWFSQLWQIKVSWEPFKALVPSFFDREMFRHYGQAMLSGSLLLLFPVIARAIASTQGPGELALFNYATRLVEFPLAVAVTFITTVLFPRLARSFTDDTKLHKDFIKYGIQITCILSLIAAASLFLLSDIYVDIVYGYGDVKHSDLVNIEALMTIGLFGLPLQGLLVFLIAVFNARSNTRTPLVLNGIGLISFCLITSVSVFPEGTSNLMWAMILSYGCIVLLQLILLKIENDFWKRVFFDKTFFAGIICCSILFLLTQNMINKLNLSTWGNSLAVFFFAIISLLIMLISNKYIRLKLKRKLGAQ